MIRLTCSGLIALVSALLVLQSEPLSLSAMQKEKTKDKVKAKDKAKAKVDPDAMDKPEIDDSVKLTPAFDPGAHTQGIIAMGFNKDNSQLITVGRDYTIQIWSSATGERLDILRLPGYSREKGYDSNSWNVATVSQDGRYVALGGQPKFLNDANDNNTSRLTLIDVVDRKLFKVQLRTGRNRAITALAISPNNETLLVAIKSGPKEDATLIAIGEMPNRFKTAKMMLLTNDCTQVSLPANVSSLSFSPDGTTLALGTKDDTIQLWEMPGGKTPKPSLTKSMPVTGITTDLAWSSDGKKLARTSTATVTRSDRRVELWNADGTLDKKWSISEMAPAIERTAQPYSSRFLSETKLYFAGGGYVERGSSGSAVGVVLDLATGKTERTDLVADGMSIERVGTASSDGKLVALAINGNTEVLIRSVGSSKASVRCGNKTAIPNHVAWSQDAASPSIAWTDIPSPNRQPAGAMKWSFDLTKIEPITDVSAQKFNLAIRKLGEWSLQYENVPGAVAVKRAHLKKGTEEVTKFPFKPNNGHTLVPNGDRPPLVAHAEEINGEGQHLFLKKSDGSRVARLRPDPTNVNDIAASPDGRYIVTTSGTARLNIYRTDGSIYPLLSFAQLNGEWVAWTPEGYYAASPGGEKMFGWAVNNGPNALASFHPAAKYAKQFHRPDILKLAIEKGSMKEALAALKTAIPNADQITQPVTKLTLIEQRGNLVKVKAVASTGQKDKPLIAMRVLRDGRPLPDGKGVWEPMPTSIAEAVFEFEVPAELCELKVLARSEDGPAASEPLTIRGNQKASEQPTIHRLCIGIDVYDDPGLKLGSAAKDAKDMFAALEKYCVGPQNRFGTAKGSLILNQDATYPKVLEALDQLSGDATKPGDLVVIFFAGHGVKQTRRAKVDGKDTEIEQFYLVTREGNPSQPLEKKSISDKEFFEGMKKIGCNVLLIMDACHSSAATRGYRSAINGMTSIATDPDMGITVMSAAMASETAGATSENGFFTAGLLKGLEAGAGVPFDPYNRQLYVHHLYSVAYSEVRKVTNGKQNPFLNIPWTAKPLSVREVNGR